MLISSIKNLNFNRINCGYPPKYNLISFKGNNDSFTSVPEIVKGLIDENELSRILNTVQQGSTNKSGYTSNIFQIGNKIVKTPKDKIFSSDIEKSLAYGQNLKEYYALSKIQEIDSDIATKPFGVIKDKDKYYLVEELIKGNHPKGNKLTQEHLSDLLTKFFKLDINGITNCDLQSGNIFLTHDGKTKLIDFGSFNFITNAGRIVGSDPIPTEIFKNTVHQDTSQDASLRFLKTFMQDGFSDIKNLADNPYLKVPSNATNFEFRTLYPHLLDGSEENPLEFFRGYLKQKAQNYHAKLKEFLESLNFDNISAADFPKEEINKAQFDLKSAINYENLIKNALQNPDDDIIKVELSKLQLRTFLNLGDSLKSPIENSKKLEAAYNQLVSTLEEGIKNSEGDKKEYFIQTLNSFKNKFKDYVFTKEQVEIPENENLIKVLFKQTVKQIEENPQTIRENTRNIQTTTKGFNKKIGLFVAPGIAIIAGVIGFILKKNKKSANTTTISKLNTDIVSNNNTLSEININSNNTVLNRNYLSKNIPDQFKEFKI